MLSTFAAVPALEILRTLLALVVISRGALWLLSADATSAFLQSPYPELEIVEFDAKLSEALGYLHGRVLRAMNGLKLSPVCWQAFRDLGQGVADTEKTLRNP